MAGRKVEQPHEILKRLLLTADGETRRVAATFVDIRGFSSFSAGGESFDAAAYLRSVFAQVLSDDYFGDADYFKPTGDGLMLVHHLPANADGLREQVSSLLERAIALVDNFGSLTSQDPLITAADVPQLLGVGIARGSATRLVSDGRVIDYTGRCLNLAARLMDKARPCGVVFSDLHSASLMTEAVAQQLVPDQVYARGVSEKPVAIFATRSVRINPEDREPPPRSSREWGDSEMQTIAEVRRHSSFGFYMRRPPRSSEKAAVRVDWPVFDESGKNTGTIRSLEVSGSVSDNPQGASVGIDYIDLHRHLKDVPETTKSIGFTVKTRVTFTPFYEPRVKRAR